MRKLPVSLATVLLGVAVGAAAVYGLASATRPILAKEVAKVAPAVVLYPGYPVSRHGIPTAVYGVDPCPNSGGPLPGAVVAEGADSSCILIQPGKVRVRYYDRDHVVDGFWDVKAADGQALAFWSDGSPVMPWDFKEPTAKR